MQMQTVFMKATFLFEIDTHQKRRGTFRTYYTYYWKIRITYLIYSHIFYIVSIQQSEGKKASFIRHLFFSCSLDIESSLALPCVM